ncbi:DUF2786 domain-containing protein [Enterobacter asburiae]|uniref:DUF2786 domain-containing protein n=1 Tax=Enterobacter asburiae TaxID=61645 RepID=UPI003EE692D5
MNKEKYLAKIKKLLNLARKATNTNEAAAALRQAQNLMREHNVTELEAEFTNISEASSKGSPNHAQTPPKYLVYLVEVIKRAFGVQAFFSWREGKYFYNSPRRVVTFYGPDSRPQIAAYAFDVLARQMTAARKEFIGELHKNTKPANRTAKADQFCVGLGQRRLEHRGGAGPHRVRINAHGAVPRTPACQRSGVRDMSRGSQSQRRRCSQNRWISLRQTGATEPRR